MKATIVRQLWEFAEQKRAEEHVQERSSRWGRKRPQTPRAAVAAIALLPFRRLFTGAEVSSKIQEFVYTFY
jgi:hypothetical protein